MSMIWFLADNQCRRYGHLMVKNISADVWRGEGCMKSFWVLKRAFSEDN